jgi:hypothetical protein
MPGAPPDPSGTGFASLDHGLYIVRASRLEALLDPLEALLAATAPDDPLIPQRVVVAHPGMRHWLLQQLALRRGGRRVVAHLAVELPGEFLDRIAQAELGAQAQSSPIERRPVLRWRIWRRFEQFEHHPQIQRLTPAQRFRYADQLAGLYARYAVYRPDWLAAWKNGRYGDEDDGLQGALWRALAIEPTRAHCPSRRRRSAPTCMCSGSPTSRRSNPRRCSASRARGASRSTCPIPASSPGRVCRSIAPRSPDSTRSANGPHSTAPCSTRNTRCWRAGDGSASISR